MEHRTYHYDATGRIRLTRIETATGELRGYREHFSFGTWWALPGVVPTELLRDAEGIRKATTGPFYFGERPPTERRTLVAYCPPQPSAPLPRARTRLRAAFLMGAAVALSAAVFASK